MRCSPVKNGWQLEHTSTRISAFVERVRHSLPHEQRTTESTYSGWMPVFMLIDSWVSRAVDKRTLRDLGGDDRDLLAAVLRVWRELHRAMYLRPEGVVLADADVLTGVDARPTLPHDDRPGRDQ